MEFTGKTVEEAVAVGLSVLDVEEKDVEIIVKEEPQKGLFGRVKGNAVVEIKKKETDLERAVNFVQGIIDMMELNAVAELTSTEEDMVITLTAKDSSMVIGYRGEVLDAIQTLAGAAANIGKKEYKKVVVDCENYRERRNETLVKLAKKLEEKATEIKREVILEPMSPYERRIIHTTLTDSQTVTTRSDGKEPNRYVVIVPNEKDEFAKPYNAGRNNDRNTRGGKRNNERGYRNGHNRNNKKPSNARPEEKRKKTISFGTYLGNSLKNND